MGTARRASVRRADGLLSDPWEVSKFYCGVIWTVAGSAGIALGLVVRTVTEIGAGLARRKRARLG